jgi:hypothetical protein
VGGRWGDGNGDGDGRGRDAVRFGIFTVYRLDLYVKSVILNLTNKKM